MNEHHSFGGLWTSSKLDILRRYLDFYVTALKDTPYKLVYIDTFAGSGKCTIKVRGTAQTIDGSACIALNTSPPFAELFFIEKKPKHVKQLKALLAAHPRGHTARIFEGSAEHHLNEVLKTQNWRNTRGVLFLDPYGLQCDWEMVKAIANTKALDVFFLVSLSGIYRQATNNLRDADSDKLEALSRFLGTSAWQRELYTQHGDLFGPDDSLRHANSSGLTSYVRKRLAEIFPKVTEPKILYQTDKSGKLGAPLYALFFAVSNPAKAAVELAAKVSREIMATLR